MPGGAREYHQEPVSKVTMEMSLFDQMYLTTDQECSPISILGITVKFKENPASTLE